MAGLCSGEKQSMEKVDLPSSQVFMPIFLIRLRALANQVLS